MDTAFSANAMPGINPSKQNKKEVDSQ